MEASIYCMNDGDPELLGYAPYWQVIYSGPERAEGENREEIVVVFDMYTGALKYHFDSTDSVG